MIVVDVKRHVLTRGHARILRAQMLTDIKHIEVQSLCHAFERPGHQSLTFVKLTSRQGDVEVAMKIPVQTRDSGDVNLLLRNRGDNESFRPAKDKTVRSKARTNTFLFSS